ncbi:YggS family pyridoxal phosphate-dependent enzyme [Candidatus Solincola tengchongensis]|uniref:YggS family pyridoxal phosphate-dependent enzyme n=1 Tax=Candidatus Solincola tengchongensis TaxID=2900693 RepID=UPI00257A5FF8|nr:YggS family pyridoxal phosphate-dependent enzyme [Candidatus Solincola tengchongensis]
MSIEENLRRVRERIARAAARAGRDPAGVGLVVVSKGRTVAEIREVLAAGHRVLGENRAQELREKMSSIAEDVEWHFVGHLQTNKVNMVVGKVRLIHSLDSLKLAEAVSSRACRLGTVQEVLVQVNISGEDSKFGVAPEEARGLLERLVELPGLRVRGLMTIAPLWAEGEEARPYFRRLRELRDELKEDFPAVDLSCLSMGMTQDYEVAVEEGADLVRVGTAVFSG